MGKFFEEMPQNVMDWIPKQETFWVATAPLGTDGHVNVSPKGLRGTFHILSPTKVWYEDVTGSGSETIAHLRENGRITILFNAFEGPPRIARLFGIGIVHEFGTPEYDQYLPGDTRTAGSRAVIVIDVHKVGTSCGYAVPFYAFLRHRTQLSEWALAREAKDRMWEDEYPSEQPSDSRPNGGLRAYWEAHSHNIDGLPSLQSCFTSEKHIGLHQPLPSKTTLTDTAVGSTTSIGERAALVFAGVILGAALSTTANTLTKLAIRQTH